MLLTANETECPATKNVLQKICNRCGKISLKCSAHLKCDGTRAETRFGLSAKETSPFKLAGEGGSVQSTTGSRGVRISGSNDSNAGYTLF